ncbi:MAG: hypothetical protein AAFY48_17950 [Bacteroidota bacterium]
MKMYSLTRLPSLLLLLTLWLGSGNTVYAQADSLWQETFTVPGVEHFAVDPLQQLLTVDTDGVMVQYNPQGQALFRYHNTTLGEDFTIDATDPFNILLFYLDQQTVILLDRTLSVRASLDLRNTDILYATAVARSHDNNLWVYDELAGRLYKLSARGDLLFTSNDFRLSENLSVGPSQIVRWGDRIVLNFPDRGLALFSVLGQLQEWWPIQQVEDLFFQSKTLYYRQSGSYYRKQILQDLVEVIAWPEGEQPQTFLRQLTRRYLLQPDGVLRVEVQKAVPIDRN